MKGFFIRGSVAAVLALSALASNAQTDKRVTDIRAKVAGINRSAAKYTKAKKDVTGISTEGAVATLFYKGKGLKKIVAKTYGETYNALSEFYFQDDGDLIFAYDRINHYDTQIGLKRPVKIVRIEQIRSYFDSGKMFKLIIGNKVVKPGTDDFLEYEKENLEIVKGILKPDDEP